MVDIVLSDQASPWLADHCPTYTLPALPMMSVVDYLAQAAQKFSPNYVITAIENISIKRWITQAPGQQVRLQSKVEIQTQQPLQLHAKVDIWDEKKNLFINAAVGTITLANHYPLAENIFSPLADSQKITDKLYANGQLFHGTAFQLMQDLQQSNKGASSSLNAQIQQVPVGILHPALLDAATHAIPHAEPEYWFGKNAQGMVAYPHKINYLKLYATTPLSGEVTCQIRAIELEKHRYPVIDLQLLQQGKLWASMRLTEILLPKGPLGAAEPAKRKAFLRDTQYFKDVTLSQTTTDNTQLTKSYVSLSNWLPGTLEHVYQSSDQLPLAREIALKEHAAHHYQLHPSQFTLTLLEKDQYQLSSACLPLNSLTVTVQDDPRHITVSTKNSHLSMQPLRDYWHPYLKQQKEWLVETLYFAIMRRFVNQVKIADPAGLANIAGQPALYLGNHQTGIESLLFSTITGALAQQPIITIAKGEHRDSWLGHLIKLSEAYQGVTMPRNIIFFDADGQVEMIKTLQRLPDILYSEGLSLMIHAEGTRMTTCRQPVEIISSVFLDFAIKAKLPVVPVRFYGALPVTGNDTRLEFPYQYGKQDYWIGTPIMPDTLEKLPLAERKQYVLQAINQLGSDLSLETPYPGDPHFAQRVRSIQKDFGYHETQAVIAACLAEDPQGQAFFNKITTQNYTDSADDQWLKKLVTWFSSTFAL